MRLIVNYVYNIVSLVAIVMLISTFFHNIHMTCFITSLEYIIFTCSLSIIVLEILLNQRITIFFFIYLMIAIAYNPFLHFVKFIIDLQSVQTIWIAINSIALSDFIIHRLIWNIKNKSKKISNDSIIYYKQYD